MIFWKNMIIYEMQKKTKIWSIVRPSFIAVAAAALNGNLAPSNELEEMN